MKLLEPFILPSKSADFFTKLSRYFYKSILQESAGTITFFMEKDEPLFLQMYVTPSGKNGEWWFPKGIVEPEDKNDYEFRAKQETKEEVGLEVMLLGKLPSNEYTFYFDLKKIKN